MTDQEKKKPPRLFLKIITQLGKQWLDKTISKPIKISTIAVISQLAIISLFYSKLPPEIPLYYSLPWGISQLAPGHHLLLLPAIALIITIANAILATFFQDKERFISLCLNWTSTIINLMVLITISKIINLAI